VGALEADVVVVGSGIGGLTAALAAHEHGLRPLVLEKDERVGGASAASGGQVWVGANHLMERQGLDDSVEDALRYVRELAAADDTIFDPAVARQWVESARLVARRLEELGVVEWETIPGYADYYWPGVAGSRPEGRYVTGALFPGRRLGDARPLLVPAPSWPVGITYAEMFEWGGIVSRTTWRFDVVERRRAEDLLTFGQGTTAAFLAAALDRGVEIRPGHAVTRLLRDGEAVVGVACATAAGELAVHGPVILATGAHDWWPDARRYTLIPPEDGGSVAPAPIAGDGIALGEAAGAEIQSVPSWAAPVVPGYRLPRPLFPGDTGFRMCWEVSMPHSFLVDRSGERFCDDAFHPAIARALLTPDARGELPHLPFFLILDDEHHRRYGLGPSLPGEPYPEGLVTSAPTLRELALALGIDPEGLEATAVRFNEGAARGADPDFGRGADPVTQRFRGDTGHPLNPNVAPVSTPPFHGLRMRLVGTGITAAGIRSGLDGRALRADGTAIPGLYAVGECSARTAGGAGYNSGYSLSRAMTFGWLAGCDVASRRASAAATSRSR